ncbi:hypothetical protein TcWFU_004967 [Taenia crassiceps]|uniref:Uncharacterized protein n=1 Tax=Taenia crassiceps TaxID=6207 RepID=A0ABR4Q9A8_9CEST
MNAHLPSETQSSGHVVAAVNLTRHVCKGRISNSNLTSEQAASFCGRLQWTGTLDTSIPHAHLGVTRDHLTSSQFSTEIQLGSPVHHVSGSHPVHREGRGLPRGL